ncbi:17638_t:CDS:2, partial [Acaulospora morrowiae]
ETTYEPKTKELQYVRIDDSNAEIEETEAENNIWKTSTESE